MVKRHTASLDIDDAIFNALDQCPEWQKRFEVLLSERDELKEQLAAADEEYARELAERDDTLQAVRYWFLDVMTHGKPPSDPRKMLRAVEKAMGI